MTMRRLMLPSALLYESMDDFKWDVASVICSSLKIFLTVFPKSINNRNTGKMREITHCPQWSCVVMNTRSQILHTGCTNINSSIDHNVTSFNVVREDGCNIKFPQLLTEIIQGLRNFRLSYNLFIRNLRSEN